MAGTVFAASPVSGAAARKEYLCPRCLQVVSAGQPHLVVWPVDDVELRRHWHSPCWAWYREHGRRVLL